MSISGAPGDDGPTFGVSLRLNRTEAQMAGNERGRVRVEQGHKRVRAYLAGELVADTTRPLLVWEVPYYPAYYFPAGDVRAALVPTGGTEHSPSRGDAELYDVKVSRTTAGASARRYPSSPMAELRDAVRIDWQA